MIAWYERIEYLHSGKLAQVPAQSHPAPHVLLEGGTDQPILDGQNRVLPQQQREEKHLPTSAHSRHSTHDTHDPHARTATAAKKKQAVTAEQSARYSSRLISRMRGGLINDKSRLRP